jgi:hypothetical protein
VCESVCPPLVLSRSWRRQRATRKLGAGESGVSRVNVSCRLVSTSRVVSCQRLVSSRVNVSCRLVSTSRVVSCQRVPVRDEQTQAHPHRPPRLGSSRLVSTAETDSCHQALTIESIPRIPGVRVDISGHGSGMPCDQFERCRSEF